MRIAMWYVYVLRSLKDAKSYVGMSDNVGWRIAEHNAGRTRSTKGRRPFKLVHTESYRTRAEARARELYLKTAAGRRVLERIEEKTS